MIVTIWRHGQAGSAVSDQLRELTGDGIDDVGFGCHHFHEICLQRGIPHPDLVLHSPWVRTRQTADIIATAFTHATLRPLAALAPGNSPPAVLTALETLMTGDTAAQHVVLVSHQPLVSRLVDYLLGEPGRAPPLSPGALTTLELPVAAKACGTLQFWAAPPEFGTDG